MRRFNKGFTLACDFEGVPSLRNDGLLKLGGEGKTVRYENISLQMPHDRESILEKIDESRKLKLYFATPALFQNGWVPDDDIIKGSGYRLELLTASTGSPLLVGGWDMGKNKGKGGHKPMLRAIPAGSVYYFQIKDGAPEYIFDSLNYCNFGQRSNEGFGLALVGGV